MTELIQKLTDPEHRVKLIVGLTVLVLCSIALATFIFWSDDEPTVEDRVHEVEAKRVVSGHYVKLKDDMKLLYLGVRSPSEDEPFYEEARSRNEALVVGKELRLRYDGQETDDDGRLVAYAFLDDETFVNEVLIREGLAYARLYPQVQRFRQRLLNAQTQARDDGAGIWSLPTPGAESSYPADPKYAEFHRPSCEVSERIKPERLITFGSRDDAFDQGMHPCDKCNP